MDPIAHLYRRAGFGATPAELAAGRQQGYAATLDQILNFDSVPDAAEAALAQFMPPLDLTRLSGIQAWWVIRMLTTSRPLVEKLTLFWHGHFATANSKVNDPAAMLQQNELFRGKGMGRFRELLLAVSQDPAMVYWLDNDGLDQHDHAAGAGELCRCDHQRAGRADHQGRRSRHRPERAPARHHRDHGGGSGRSTRRAPGPGADQ